MTAIATTPNRVNTLRCGKTCGSRRTVDAMKTRRERLAELERAEALNRCAHCKINLRTVTGPIVQTLAGRRFCSDDCYQADEAWTTFCDERRRAQR